MFLLFYLMWIFFYKESARIIFNITIEAMSVVSAPEVLFACHIKISMSTMTIKTEMKCIFILKTKNSKIKN